MAEEINGIKIVATVTPELDQNKTKKVVKELKDEFESGLKGLDFSESAVKAAKAVDDAIEEAVKASKLYASKGGKSKAQALKSVEQRLRGVSPLSLRDDKAASVEALKIARKELSQIKASKGLPKASIEAVQSRIDAAIVAAQRMRPSKKMLAHRAPMGSAIAKSAEKTFPEHIQKERADMARKLAGLIPEIEKMPWEKSNQKWNSKEGVIKAINDVFDKNLPVENAMNYARDTIQAAFKGTSLTVDKKISPTLKKISGLGVAAKTLDTSSLERPVKKDEGKAEIQEDINKVIDELEEKKFYIEMAERMNPREKAEWSELSDRIKALKKLRDEGVKTVGVEGKSTTDIAQTIADLENTLREVGEQHDELTGSLKKSVETLEVRLKYLKKLQAEGVESIKDVEPESETKVSKGKTSKKHAATDKIREAGNERAKATLQEEKDRKDAAKTRREASAARKAAKVKEIEEYLARNTNPDGTYKWGVYLGKNMTLKPKRRSGAVVKTTLDALHEKGEALAFNKHRIFRKYDPSYRAGAWYTKNPTEAVEGEKATAAIDKARESMTGLSAEFKQVYLCIGNLTDTVNALIRYLVEKEAEKALRKKGGTAKAEEQKPREPFKYSLGKSKRGLSGLTMSESLKYNYGKQFKYDSPGQLTFKEAMNWLEKDANSQPKSLGGWIKRYFQQISLRSKLFKAKGSDFIKSNPVVSGLRGLRDDARARKAARANRLEERLKARAAKVESKLRLETLRAESKQNRKKAWERRREKLTSSPLSKLFGLGGKFMSSTGNKMFGPFGRGLKKVGSFIKTIKRAFRYRVVRNLVNRIIKLIREGFTNLDKYSEHMGTNFHKNVLKLTSSLLYMKNAFAAMAAPIVNALTPALEVLMDKFAMLANYIGAFFAAITGQSQFTAALKKMVTTTQQTAGKLLDILGFDEINRLSGDNGGGENVDEMFEEWGEGTIFTLLRDAFQNQEWEEIGTILAEKVNDIIKGLKEKDIGKELGKKIGAAITTARYFIERLDFKNMGATLATWLNNMVAGIDWYDLGRAILGYFSGTIDFFIGLISTLDWSKMGSALHDIIVGVFKGFKKWLADIDWRQMGLDLVQALVDFITNLDILDVLGAFVELGASLLKGIASMIGGIIQGLLESIFGDLPNWLVRLLGGETTTIEMKATIQERVDAALSDESRGFIEKLLITLFPEKFSKAVEEQKPFVLQLFHDLNGVIGPALNVISPSTAGIFNWMDDVYDNITWVGTSVGKLATYQHTGATGAGEQPYTGGAGGGGRQTLPRNAAGGTINKGQLFIANEAGPELIGSLNGRTSVTNYDQFTQSVITANALVVDAVMQVVSAINNKDLDVYMDSQKVGQSVTQYQNSMARRFGY